MTNTKSCNKFQKDESTTIYIYGGQMKKYGLFLVLSMVILIYQCSSPYNIDYPAPSADIAPEQLFPQEIDGMSPNIKEVNVANAERAYEAYYGDNIVISGIYCEDHEAAGRVFSQYTGNIKSMPSYVYNNIGDKRFAAYTSTDGSEWFVWTNENWLFEIAGVDEPTLQKVVQAFDYVSAN